MHAILTLLHLPKLPPAFFRAWNLLPQLMNLRSFCFCSPSRSVLCAHSTDHAYPEAQALRISSDVLLRFIQVYVPRNAACPRQQPRSPRDPGCCNWASKMPLQVEELQRGRDPLQVASSHWQTITCSWVAILFTITQHWVILTVKMAF